MNVVVLCGGAGSKRYVSLSTGYWVSQALEKLGHQATVIDPVAWPDTPNITPDVLEPGDPDDPILKEKEEACYKSVDFWEQCMQADVVLNAFYGGIGANGTVTRCLRAHELKTTGGNRLYCCRGQDIGHVYADVAGFWVNTPRSASLQLRWDGRGMPISEMIAEALGPTVVLRQRKPECNEGEYLAEGQQDIANKLKFFKEDVVVEEYFSGKELTVGVLHDTALPVLEKRYSGRRFDEQGKYVGEGKHYVFPAEVPEELQAQAQEKAVLAVAAVAREDPAYGKVDFILDTQGRLRLHGFTPLPVLLPDSAMGIAAAKSGMGYEGMIQRLLDIAF